MQAWGMAHSDFWWSSINLDSCASNVLFILSTIPLDWGWNGLHIPKCAHISWKILLPKLQPWFDCSSNGTPCWQTFFHKDFCYSSGLWVGQGVGFWPLREVVYNYQHILVPNSDIHRGPSTSSATYLVGAPTFYLDTGARSFLGGPLWDSHKSRNWHQSFTSWWQCGQ